MDSMRTNDISQWENVYLSNKNTFASCNKRNLGVYRCIREEEYETLEKCAEYWIEIIMWKIFRKDIIVKFVGLHY